MSTLRPLALALAALFALTAAPGQGQNPKDKDPKTDAPPLPNEAQVMQVKLKHAQTLMAAIAMEDYKKLDESATALARISQATAFLRAYKTEEYEFQARVFRRSAEVLAEKARDKNLDGATLAYLDMQVSCVGCHNHFRKKTRD